jgi:glycosyltransferase involved in cell wall biosynthesis
LNILIVADVSIERIIGGAERVLYEQSYRLSQRGHTVHIITRKLVKHQESRVIINGVSESRYECDKKDALSFIKTTWINSKRLFESLHERYHFDCINFHQPFSALGVVHSSLSQSMAKIYTCHSLSFEEFISRNGIEGGLFKKTTNFMHTLVRKWSEKKVLKSCDDIIALSRFTSKKLCEVHKIPSHKVSIIHGGVDLTRFSLPVNKSEIRKTLKIPSDRILLFTVRNLVGRMGLENLVHAFEHLVNNGAEVFLVIGGEGPLKNELFSLTKKLGIEEYIRFTGYIPEKELPAYYQMADLFILPTKELEGFGLVTLEAMASGLPVLGTPIGGTKEILGEFDARFLFGDINPESMAKLIMDMYNIIRQQPQHWEQITNQCRQFVQNHYSWDKNIDSLERLFLKYQAK